MSNLNIPFSPRLVIIFENSLAQTVVPCCVSIMVSNRTNPRGGSPKGHIQFIAQHKNKFFKLIGFSHFSASSLSDAYAEKQK